MKRAPPDPSRSDGPLQAGLERQTANTSCLPAPPHWSSQQLFGGRHEIQIAHGESVYRLRITALGKLILTK